MKYQSRRGATEDGRAKKVFTKALDIAEAEGRFRPLISRKDVGWDTPYYKLHHTHPRYIIPE